MSAKCEILAELTLDERSPLSSGRQLVEWVKRCAGDGIVVPASNGTTIEITSQLCEEAASSGLRSYVELTDPSVLQSLPRHVDGYLVRTTAAGWPSWLKPLKHAHILLILDGATLVGLHDRLKPLGHRRLTLIYVPSFVGQLVDFKTPLTDLKHHGYPVGYSDTEASPWLSVVGAQAGASVVVKGLTLNRSLGGVGHQSSLYPVEYKRMVDGIRDHEASQVRLRDRLAEELSKLAHVESLVAARELKAGTVLRQGDLKRTPRLVGLTAPMESQLIGKRLLYDCQPDDAITFGLLEPWAAQQAATPLDISVVLRTKNEGKWLRRSLAALVHQQRPPREIIVVDNDSSDETVAIASSFGCRIQTIHDDEFSFGRALNRGIVAASSEWVISLSAHCVPVHDLWLSAFSCECTQPFMAAVYGRQEPLPDSSDFDKRDLWITFGAERRVQQGQDYFFHNANSMIRKEVWGRVLFDETLSGVEDRDWAKKVLAAGWQIVYTPLASVYHYHGIHQGRDERRAQRVARVIELIHERPHVPTAASVSSLEG